jgi:ubiquinone/menaquinone biosynthesis C-methylase UbiE
MFNRWLATYFPNLRQAIARRWYNYISTLDKDAHMLFMNYGYTDLDPKAKPLELSAEDEKHRYPIQLYHRVASAIDWAGLEALEVGSGRGGGACYIMRRFRPKSIIGLDLAVKAIDFCHRYYSLPGLSFAPGNAECLPFADHSFDVIINLESSLYYPNIGRFLSEVVRVLKPNGYFLYADMRYQEEIDNWQTRLRRTGLDLLHEEDITPNVVKALALDNERKRKLINQYVPKILHRPFYEFAGITGAGLAHGSPRAGERLYLNFVLHKVNAR